jgi:pyruvate dehydrogenase E1 component
LLPIGTLYDPFVARALEALIYGVYQGGRFIVVGTPSGVTLAPEGGAHQSVVTPTVGLATPQITYWEPCFAQDLEWILLEVLSALHRSDSPEASYLRLSTAPVDQTLLPSFEDRETQLRAVLSGVYRILDRSREPGARSDNQVHIGDRDHGPRGIASFG